MSKNQIIISGLCAACLLTGPASVYAKPLPPVAAEDVPEVREGETAADETQEQNQEDQPDLGFDVDEFYAQTQNKFGQYSQQHEDLKSNYGNLNNPSGEDLYMDYLKQSEQSALDTDYYKRLEMMQNMDLTLSDPQLNSAYKKAQGQVSSALAGYNLDISANPTQRELEKQSENKKALETLTGVSDNAEKYQQILKEYEYSGTLVDTYTVKDMSKLDADSPLTKSIQARSEFKNIDSLYKSIKSGNTIETVSNQYKTKDPSEFHDKAKAAIKQWVRQMTDGGNTLTKKQHNEVQTASDNLAVLNRAIANDDQAQIADSMEKVSNFMIRHQIEL